MCVWADISAEPLSQPDLTTHFLNTAIFLASPLLLSQEIVIVRKYITAFIRNTD